MTNPSLSSRYASLFLHDDNPLLTQVRQEDCGSSSCRYSVNHPPATTHECVRTCTQWMSPAQTMVNETRAGRCNMCARAGH
ncbi:hypothetical protein OF83DRAFT_300485 [Amylostereum chailletii]|nr:hypothetical protein OF83DRAFT_300485 [Amylostereum chailletii]